MNLAEHRAESGAGVEHLEQPEVEGEAGGADHAERAELLEQQPPGPRRRVRALGAVTPSSLGGDRPIPVPRLRNDRAGRGGRQQRPR